MPSVVICEKDEFGLFDLVSGEVVPVSPGDLMFLASDPAESFVHNRLSVFFGGVWDTVPASQSAVWWLAREWGFSADEIRRKQSDAERKSRHMELQAAIGVRP